MDLLLAKGRGRWRPFTSPPPPFHRIRPALKGVARGAGALSLASDGVPAGGAADDSLRAG